MSGKAVFFTGLAICLLLPALRADEWPQWRGPGRDGVWNESGLLEKFAGAQLKLRWRVPIAGGYTGPTVAQGRVYVADRVTEPQEVERVHCFDWTDGKRVWSYAYPCNYGKIEYRAGPRASITIDDGRAYHLGSVGHFHCFDAASGEVLWKKDLAVEYKIRIPTWGISAAPLIEGDLVILHVGGQPGACIIAFDKETGRQQWTALDDLPSYSAPIVIDQAGRRVLVCWTGARLAGLNPATGELYWQHPFPFRQWSDQIITPVRHKDRLFVSTFLEGSLMLRLGEDRLAVEQVWRRQGRDEQHTEGLHCLMSNPLVTDGYVYGIDSYGQLRCLATDTGDRVWEDRTATSQLRWGNAHMVRNGDKIWMFNDLGDLIIARLSPQGFEPISRARLIKPTRLQLPRRDGVTWSHPAFAHRHVFARNDEELVCASLAAGEN